jgi:two-component system, NarL family, invasion response regulator UvrY
MSVDKIRIMLVDDHAVVRAGLCRLIEYQAGMQVICEADSGEAAYQLFDPEKIDVLVMDLSMPGMGGLESARRILSRHPKSKIVIFSMHDNATFATQVMKAGIKGYVTKTGAYNDLIGAVQEVAAGKVYLSDEIAKKIAMQNMAGDMHPLNLLSAREFEVFRLLADGLTTDAVGDRLKISQKTVANYHSMIKQKLNVNSPIEMLRLAMRYGLIEN